MSRAPEGIRTPVTAVKGRCPRPLDEGRVAIDRPEGAAGPNEQSCGGYKGLRRQRQANAGYHFPVFPIDFHGSCGGLGEPLCSNSIECLSGERTKAMTPSRGGRLMVTPAFIRRSQVSQMSSTS